MKNPARARRPERVLLLIARDGESCRGTAIRFSDEQRIRFDSVAELTKWLVDPPEVEGAPLTGRLEDGEGGDV